MPKPSPQSPQQDPIIVCGISSQTTEHELAEMIEAGVGEVFAGYVTPEWLDRYGLEVSPNRRYFLERQIVDRKALDNIGDITRSAGANLVITLNEHYYAPGPRKMLWEIVDHSLSAGAKGFIVADLELVDALHRRLGDDVELIVSTEAGVFNTNTANVFVHHGAKRVVFPREMKIAEMESIVEEVSSPISSPGVEYEAFVVREYCINSSAYCTVVHGYGRREHFCASHLKQALWDSQRQEQVEREAKTVAWSTDPAFLEATLSLSRCGFCALERMLKMGVRYLKVPGRSASALKAARLLNKLLKGGDLSPEACREIVGSEAFCRTGEYCYYNLDSPAKGPLASGRLASVPLARSKQTAKIAASRPEANAPSASRQPTEYDISVYLPWDAIDSSTVGSLKARGLTSILDFDRFAANWEAQTAERTLALLSDLGVTTREPPSRIYLSMEHCALRMPSQRQLLDGVTRLHDSGFRVSLVTPIAFESLRPRLIDMIDAVVAANDNPDFELIINDLGLLAVAADRWPVTLALGRMLNQMKRQQLVDDPELKPAAEALQRVPDECDDALGERLEALLHVHEKIYGYPYLSSTFYQSVLRDWHVSRIETDTLPTPLSAALSADFAHSLLLPWTYLSTTRSCQLAIAVEGAVSSYPIESCRRSCGRYLLLPEYPWPHRRIVQRGASTFMDCTTDVPRFVESMKSRLDRLVIEPFVPY